MKSEGVLHTLMDAYPQEDRRVFTKGGKCNIVGVIKVKYLPPGLRHQVVNPPVRTTPIVSVSDPEATDDTEKHVS